MVELAGKKWMFKEIVFTEMSDGKLGLTKDETEKINFSVANAICSSEDKMSTDELEFLCEITATRAIEVSRFVRKSPSTVTRWFDRDKPRELDFGNSLILKQFFWVKIFNDLNRSPSMKKQLNNMGKLAINELRAVNVLEAV